MESATQNQQTLRQIDMGKRLSDRQWVFLLLAVTLGVYVQVLGFPWISWDDPEMVFANKDVRAFDASAFFRSHYVGNYLPLTMLLHAASYFAFGDHAGLYHLLNVVLHMLNGWLVFRLSASLFKSSAINFCACAVFLLHPLQVESVAWISELKNIVFTTFFLSGLVAYTQPRAKRSALWLSGLFFVLSCLCKPSAVVFPLTMLCVDLIRDEKFSVKHGLRYLPFLAVAIAFGVVNLYTQRADNFINLSHAFPILQRMSNAGLALANYMRLLLLPFGLSVIYPFPAHTAANGITGWIVLLALLSLGVWLWRKNHRQALGIVSFMVANLVLVLQLIPFGEVLYADRYAYLSVVGMGWMIGLGFEKFNLRINYAMFCIIALLSILTFARLRPWNSSLHLFTDILKKYPNEFLALNSAGVECMHENMDSESLRYLEKAAAVSPDNYKGFYNLGLLHLKNQRYAEAVAALNRSLALYDYNKAYIARATAYYLSGDLARALNDANRAIELDPEAAKAHYTKGNVLSALNQLEQAMASYNRAVKLDGNDAEFYFKRGIVYGKQQDFPSCISDLELALHLKADLYEAYYWLGVAKYNLHRDPCPDLSVAASHLIEPAQRALQKFCR